MLEYDPICEQILRMERQLLKLKREYETLNGPVDVFGATPLGSRRERHTPTDPISLCRCAVVSASGDP
jgi:hypothetical protein